MQGKGAPANGMGIPAESLRKRPFGTVVPAIIREMSFQNRLMGLLWNWCVAVDMNESKSFPLGERLDLYDMYLLIENL